MAIVDRPLGPQANRVDARTIGTESLQLAVAAEDPLARRKRVRLIDLAERGFIEYRSDSSLRASIDAACRAAGLQRRVVCEADTIADLVELVALGLGVSILPPAAIRAAGGRALGLVIDPPIPRDLVLVTPRDRAPSPAGAAFLELLDQDLYTPRGGKAEERRPLGVREGDPALSSVGDELAASGHLHFVHGEEAPLAGDALELVRAAVRKRDTRADDEVLDGA